MGQKATSFIPINQAHAIVEVVMFVQFEHEFDDILIQKLLELAQELKEELPQHKVVQRIEATFEGGQARPQKLPAEASVKSVGVELQSFKRDGTLAWMLRTLDNGFSVHCLDYSTWEEVWAQARKYLYKAFHKLEGTDNKISIIGLKYVDRFLYEGSREEYTPYGLFNAETDLIFRRAFSATPIWHCHVGWFEDLQGFGPCINQLNINTIYGNISGSEKHITNIDHNAIFRIKSNGMDFAPFIRENDDNTTYIHQVMNALHLMNKHILAHLLCKEMARRINLGVEM